MLDGLAQHRHAEFRHGRGCNRQNLVLPEFRNCQGNRFVEGIGFNGTTRNSPRVAPGSRRLQISLSGFQRAFLGSFANRRPR